MAGQLTDIQAEDENKTNSLIPRSKDTIAEKAKLVSFWFAIFTPGVVEAVYKNTMYLDYYGANPAAPVCNKKSSILSTSVYLTA